MSSIRKFRDLASRLFRLTQVASKDNPVETSKEFDAMLDSIAEMLEVTERTKTEAHVLSTVADNNLNEMAFGYPMFRMFPSAFPPKDDRMEEDVEDKEDKEDKGPSLIIHKDQKTPTIKVTKIDGEDGTPLESLFQRFPYDGEEYPVDHESLDSDEVGADVEDELIPMDHEGKSYFRSTESHRMFLRNADGTQGPCVGVWMFDQFVPITVVPPEEAVPAVLVEKVEQ